MKVINVIESSHLLLIGLNRRKVALFGALFAVLCLFWGHWEWEHERTRLLHNAAVDGDNRAVKALLDNGVSPDAQNFHSRSALQAAAYSGHADTVRLLLDRGATPSNAALCAAAHKGHTDILAMLLARGANVDGEAGAEALGSAVEGGSVSAVILLLKRGGKLNQKDDFGTLPIQRAAGLGSWALGGSWAIFRTLVDHGADVKARSAYGETTLMYAARSDNPDSERICRYLIRQGANVNARDNERKTALIYAVEIRRGDESGGTGLAILKMLLESGAEVNARDEQGKTAFRYASEFRDSGAKILLRRAGAW